MRDLHVHTTYSDGRNTAEEMVLEAIARGMECIGFSEHSHTVGDSAAMSEEGTLRYREGISRLKEAYDGRIRVLCGLERDYWSDDTLDYDYVIGSVHILRMPDGDQIDVDGRQEKLPGLVERYFGGDMYAYAEAYYRQAGDVVRKTRCDIIGHFDLIAIHNETGGFFDETHPRYVRAWHEAADRLLETGKPFEINTGVIARGYRSVPYPAAPICQYIRERGGKLILNSDAHRREDLCFGFDKWRCLL